MTGNLCLVPFKQIITQSRQTFWTPDKEGMSFIYSGKHYSKTTLKVKHSNMYVFKVVLSSKFENTQVEIFYLNKAAAMLKCQCFKKRIPFYKVVVCPLYTFYIFPNNTLTFTLIFLPQFRTTFRSAFGI